MTKKARCPNSVNILIKKPTHIRNECVFVSVGTYGW